MVSPGTHLIKNHETMSITNESLLKTTRGHKLKVFEPLCNQTVNLETDDKTLYCSLVKLKYRLKQNNTVDSPYIDSCLNLSTQRPLSSVPKAKVADMERFNCMHASSNNSHKFTRTRYSTKKFSNRSMVLCIPRDTFHELFWWDPKNHKSTDFLVDYPVCAIPVAVV